MPKNYANIYKLSKQDFENETQNLWANSIPNAQANAEMLTQEICNEETPFVLSVEAPYGMGKTYFFTRFCEHLKKNGIPCIYISAWENDYAPSPFLYLLKEILNFFDEELSPTTKSKITTLKKKGIEVGKKLLSSISIQCSGVEVNLGSFISSFLKDTDEVQHFKNEFSKKIKQLHKNAPLVIIVDELDRCRPDYALKTIEIMKHFFDIDQVFFIIPINKGAISEAVSAVYGQTVARQGENYLRKLIDKEIILPSPNKESYKQIASSVITKEKLKLALDNGFIEDNDNYNGFAIIAEHFGNYAKQCALTFRETVQVCETFIQYANNIPHKIHIEYLIFLLCNKFKKNDILTTSTLTKEHPYSGVDAPRVYGKRKILCINGLLDATNGFQYDRWHFNYSQLCRSSENFSSYNEFYGYIETCRKLMEEGKAREGDSRIKNLTDVINKAEQEVKEYQRKFGSCDEDEQNKAYYEKIVGNNLLIFSSETQ